MLSVSSTSELVNALANARTATVTAYVLRPGRVLGALEAAGDRGAEVKVRLESKPYGDDGSLQAGNDGAIAELRAHRVDAGYRESEAPVHMKAALVDGQVFLDDRNWPDDGHDFILRTADADDVAAVASAATGAPGRDGHLETEKARATSLEAKLIYGAPADEIACESESFGFSSVYGALKARVQHGDSVRLLVAERDLRAGANRWEHAALKRLGDAGVRVRVGPDDEKLCVAGDEAWVGSANATDGASNQIDWGMRSRVPAVVGALRERFERNWAAGRPFVA